jgi:hypothetical protein
VIPPYTTASGQRVGPSSHKVVRSVLATVLRLLRPCVGAAYNDHVTNGRASVTDTAGIGRGMVHQMRMPLGEVLVVDLALNASLPDFSRTDTARWARPTGYRTNSLQF